MSLIDYNINNLLFALLMSFRLGAFFKAMPSFADVRLGMVMNVVLPIGMAFLIAPVLSYDVMPIMTSGVIAVSLAILVEILVGVVMGFALNIIVVLASMVGELTGMQAGFAMASFFDPNLGQVSLLAFFTRNMFLMAFFLFNIHHAILMGVVRSYEAIPVGSDFLVFSSIVPALVKLFAGVYFMAFRIVLPIIVIILLSHVTMGIVSITAPQMNIYFNAAITLNIVVALIFFAVSFPAIFRFFQIALGNLEDFMMQFFVIAT